MQRNDLWVETTYGLFSFKGQEPSIANIQKTAESQNIQLKFIKSFSPFAPDQRMERYHVTHIDTTRIAEVESLPVRFSTSHGQAEAKDIIAKATVEWNQLTKPVVPASNAPQTKDTAAFKEKASEKK